MSNFIQGVKQTKTSYEKDTILSFPIDSVVAESTYVYMHYGTTHKTPYIASLNLKSWALNTIPL